MTRTAFARLVLFLIAALVASLAVKVAGISRMVTHDEARLLRDLTRTMEAQGHTVQTGSGNWWDAGLVTARKGGCTVQMRNATRYGVDREAATRTRMTAGPLTYFRSGSVSPDYPRFRSELTWRLQHELGRFGLPRAIQPTIAVAATGPCAPDPRWLEPVRLYLREA